MTLTQMLGQKLVFGFHGTSLSPEFKALIRKYKIGNAALTAKTAAAYCKL